MLQKQIQAAFLLTVNSSNFETFLPHPNIEESSFAWTPDGSFDGLYTFNKSTRYLAIVGQTFPIALTLNYTYKGIKKSDLLARLTGLVAQSEDIALNFELALDEAVGAFNDTCKFKGQYWFTTLVGKTEYILPAFVTKVLGVFESSATIYHEQVGDSLVLTYKPTVSRKHKVDYFGSHIPNADGVYEMLDDAAANIILVRAQANLMRQKAMTLAEESFNYTLADDGVNKNGLSGAVKQQADSLDTQFKERVKSYNGLAISYYVTK